VVSDVVVNRAGAAQPLRYNLRMTQGTEKNDDSIGAFDTPKYQTKKNI